MTEILVVSEARRGHLAAASYELVGAARELAGSAGHAGVSVAIIDHDPTRYLDALNLPGIDRIFTVPTENEHFDAQIATDALRRLIEAERPTVVLLTHSITSMAFAPAAAALLETGFASDAVGLSWADGLVVRRGAYSGKLIAELDFPGKRTTIVMVRPRSFAPAAGDGAGSAEVVRFDSDPVQPTARHLQFRDPDTFGVDITRSPFVLSIGRGIKDQEGVARLHALADRMGATLGVSGPLVEAGWAPGVRKVGQSGKTVKPKVYLALGISGAVQHLSGIRDAGTIIAVNSDPTAPIFKVANYGVVANLFDVVDELERRYR